MNTPRIAAISQQLGSPRELLIALSMLLFPLAGNTITGWNSYLFTLLCLLSLTPRYLRAITLTQQEKGLLLVVAVLFSSFMLSNLINGWTAKQTSEFGVEVRYLLFIPLYFLLRAHPKAILWLMAGSFIGLFVTVLQALYDLLFLGLDRAYGIYKSPGFLAMGSLMLLTLTIPLTETLNSRKIRRLLLASATIAALLILILSGSRSGYLVVIGWLTLLGALHFGWRGALTAIGAILIGGWLAYSQVDLLKERVDRAVNEIAFYLDAENKNDGDIYFGSAAQRFPLWHSALLLYRDNPVWGVGRGNYETRAKEYAARGELHPVGASHPHPHSGYLEIMASNGTIGLILFLTLLGYTVFLFRYGNQGMASQAGWAFALLILLIALLEPAPFIYGNFLALYLITLGGLTAWQHQLAAGVEPRALLPAWWP